jgi:hypothetical protein
MDMSARIIVTAGEFVSMELHAVIDNDVIHVEADFVVPAGACRNVNASATGFLKIDKDETRSSSGNLTLDTCVLNEQQEGAGDTQTLWKASLTFPTLDVRSQSLSGPCEVTSKGIVTLGAATSKVISPAVALVRAPAPAPSIVATGCWGSYIHFGDECQPAAYTACGFTCVGRNCGVGGRSTPECTSCPPLPYLLDHDFNAATATCTIGTLTHHPVPAPKQEATGCYLVKPTATACSVERLRFCGLTCNSQLCASPSLGVPSCSGCDFPAYDSANATLSVDLVDLACIEPPDVVLESAPGEIKSSAFSTGILPTPVIW